MKKSYLFLATYLGLSLSLFAQSNWLKPTKTYIKTKDIIPEKSFSCHDIQSDSLYAIAQDGHLYSYDLNTLTQVNDYGTAPSSYMGAFVSFITADLNGMRIWVGYTSVDLKDDRIYKIDITTKTWTHMATLPGNFDMEISNGYYFVSGLNKEGWDGVNDVNAISILDTTGSNAHKKIIEIGGNSTGLALDNEGNIYNAKYDPANTETYMYRWKADSIQKIIDATDSSFLTLSSGTLITAMPNNGPYDCDVDQAGNLIFNCNDFAGGSFLALWDGKANSDHNYKKIGTYGGDSFAWFSMVKATGDIHNGGKIYMINFGSPLAEIYINELEVPGKYVTSSFEDLGLEEEESFWNGSAGEVGFSSGIIQFTNNYNIDWNFWNGFAYSNTSDTITAGFSNQYSAFTGTGFDTSTYKGSTYGIGYVSGDLVMTFKGDTSHLVKGMYVTNSTYAALSMKQGDTFAKKFGGDDGTEPDFFALRVWGMKDGSPTDTIDFYLADFRFEDSSQDYIVDTWEWVELSSLGWVDSIMFGMKSSDVGDFGINTPTYFMFDNVFVEPYAPFWSRELPTLGGYVGRSAITVDLSTYFSNPSLVDVNYSITGNSFDSVALVSIESGILNLSLMDVGQTTLTITAEANGTEFTTQLIVASYPNVNEDYVISDFEDLALNNESFWNGSDGSGGFASGVIQFANHYNNNWDFWNGFAYSNTSDITTAGFTNQYSAITGTGFDTTTSGGKNYGVSFSSPFSKVKFTDAGPAMIKGMYVTNSTYTALSMEQGDAFAKKFGGEDGKDSDWFKLTVWGMKGGETVDSVEFYLADFRFEDSGQDYIVKTWQWVELSSLGRVDSLTFSLSSSDIGDWGMNTPAYFMIDNIMVTPDQAPTLAQPIADVAVSMNASDTIIPLANVFEDKDGDTILKSLKTNSNNSIVTANVDGDELTLSFTDDASGVAEIVIEGLSNGKSAMDTLLVTINAIHNVTGTTESLISQVLPYPNPSNGVFKLKTTENKTIAITIISASGNQVYANDQHMSNEVINISMQPAGLYFIRISDSYSTQVQSFIIK